MLDEGEADTLLYGHIHYAYTRQVGERTVACVGSVGVPLDGDEHPCFLIAVDDGSGWALEHVRVSYDRDRYLAELARSDLPNASSSIEMIRKAGAP
jgi:diadenosine tetraphosphatase ApaH/serine/threonine PP2A family protein phosphatase